MNPPWVEWVGEFLLQAGGRHSVSITTLQTRRAGSKIRGIQWPNVMHLLSFTFESSFVSPQWNSENKSFNSKECVLKPVVERNRMFSYSAFSYFCSAANSVMKNCKEITLHYPHLFPNEFANLLVCPSIKRLLVLKAYKMWPRFTPILPPITKA